MQTYEGCNCYNGHNDDCESFDFKQGYANLKSDIESIQTMLSDGFEVRFFATSEEFVCEAKHPQQTEEFLNDSVFNLVQKLSEWVSFCKAAE